MGRNMFVELRPIQVALGIHFNWFVAENLHPVPRGAEGPEVPKNGYAEVDQSPRQIHSYGDFLK